MNRPPTRRETEKEFRRLLRDMLRGWMLATGFRPYLIQAGENRWNFGKVGRAIWPSVAKLAEDRIPLKYEGNHGIGGWVHSLPVSSRRLARRILARRLS